MPDQPTYDALLYVSFGGPESPEDVMPFLENVVRGRPVPRERLEKVAKHYYHFDGKSPINEQNRAIVSALETELAAANLAVPVYFGNRNWHPFIKEALEAMQRDGIKRALAFVTSAFSSYSGCRQYREHIEEARRALGEAAPIVDKLRAFYNHPRYVEAVSERIRDAFRALESKPEISHSASTRLVFTAHSLPTAMAASSDYVAELRDASDLVAHAIGTSTYDLVFQSRSGPPGVPWLEPDVLDHLGALADEGVRRVVLSPIGFITDHMEIVWDLDVEAQNRATELGIELVRAGTAGSHPVFAPMIRELIEERIKGTPRLALGTRGPKPDRCPADCCVYTPRRPRT